MMVDVTPGRACTHEIATRETVEPSSFDARHLVEEIVGLVVQRTGRQAPRSASCLPCLSRVYFLDSNAASLRAATTGYAHPHLEGHRHEIALHRALEQGVLDPQRQ